MNNEMFRGFLVVAWNGAGQRVGSFTAMSNSRTACGVSCLTMKANIYVYTDLCHCVYTLMHFPLFVYYTYDILYCNMHCISPYCRIQVGLHTPTIMTRVLCLSLGQHHLRGQEL